MPRSNNHGDESGQTGQPRQSPGRICKYVFDRVAAAVGLLVLSPLIALTALAVLFSMGRPVFFRQVRPGYRARPFTLVKFRTMRIDPDAAISKDAARLTSLGGWLRRFSLDELPQLWNVLRGDMSLVGPRPLLMEYLPVYSAEQARRHDVRPGITGLAQVKGRNALSWEEKFKWDVWYVDHWSLSLDMRILMQTMVKVFKREGISQQGHATMTRFDEESR